MSNKLKTVAVCVGLIIIVYFSYNYSMTGGAREVQKEKSKFILTAVAINTEFVRDSKFATIKYLNKAIEVSGRVTQVSKNLLMIDGKVSCQFEISPNVAVNSQVILKGRLTGYDDLLEEVKLDQCLIIK